MTKFRLTPDEEHIVHLTAPSPGASSAIPPARPFAPRQLPPQIRAVHTNEQVVIHWEKTGCDNCIGFFIERSCDGQNWQRLGFIRFCTTRMHYAFADLSPEAGKQCYRLVQADYFGNNTYSNTIWIAL